MKPLQIHALLVLALLCCIAGCTKTTYENTTFGCGVPVDGIDYSANGMARIAEDGTICRSAILVFESLETVHASIGIETKAETDPGKILIHSGDQKGSLDLKDPKCFTVYFVKDRQILFSKTYAELGIDATKSFPGDFSETKLRPILEKLIREAELPRPPKDEIKSEEPEN